MEAEMLARLKPLGSILEAIGKTPVVKLNKCSPDGVNIYVCLPFPRPCRGGGALASVLRVGS